MVVIRNVVVVSHQVYFTAQAATNVTVVDAWSHHTPGEITSTGRRAIESAGSHFYFTSPGPQGDVVGLGCAIASFMVI